MRNTYAICPQQGDSSVKTGLIPRNIIGRHLLIIKSEEVADEHAYDLLVGGVTAHQDDDH